MAKIVKLGMSCKKYSKKKKNGQEMQKKRNAQKYQKNCVKNAQKPKKMPWNGQ